MLRFFALALFVLFSLASWAEEKAVSFRSLEGQLGIHDPSIVYFDSTYVAFATGVERAPDGGAIRIKTSKDGISWRDAGTLGFGLPDWVAPALGQTPPNLWAPSVSVHGDELYVYYAASSFGKNLSAIGLTVNAAFDPDNPGAGWQDRGIVFRSYFGDTYNAIDPVRFDTEDGLAFLAFGSWWDGIRMIALDPQTGMRLAGSDEVISLASRGGGAIEAPALMTHNGHFYLFVSFDLCCRGTASTYNIRVGRATDLAGPYFDRDGVPMLKGGGTLVLEKTGRYYGPGGQEVFTGPDGLPMLAFHYYDGSAAGAPKLQIVPIGWDEDGWPVIGEN